MHLRVPCRGVDAGINADDMTMYYDEKLKRWVDPAAPESSEAVVAGPPPIKVQDQTPAPEPVRSEPGGSSGTADLMAPPPSFRKKRGARGTPAKTSTAALPGGPAMLTPGVPSGGETNFSAEGTEGVSASAGGSATDEAEVGPDMQGAASGESEAAGSAPSALGGFAVFTPAVSASAEGGEDGDADGDDHLRAADEWLEFKPPEPEPDSDDEGHENSGDGSGAAGEDGYSDNLAPGMGLPSDTLPGMNSPSDGTAAASWMGAGEDIAGLIGGDEWSGTGGGGGGGELGAVDDFTAGLAFSAPPGMEVGVTTQAEDTEELSGDARDDSSPVGQVELAPTAYWGGGSGSIAEDEATQGPEPEPEPTPEPDLATHGAQIPDASQDAMDGASMGAEQDDDMLGTAESDSPLAAARAAQTARLAAQIARLKRASDSADGDDVAPAAAASDSGSGDGEHPPPVDQDEDDEESEFDPCVIRPTSLLTVPICAGKSWLRACVGYIMFRLLRVHVTGCCVCVRSLGTHNASHRTCANKKRVAARCIACGCAV